MTTATLYRISAFTDSPLGGNPAGVWVGTEFPDEACMQGIATRVGYSETAFVVPEKGFERRVRYFSPEAEVSFCGHATIAAGAVLGEASGDGVYEFMTSVGHVPVAVQMTDGGLRECALTSVVPKHKAVPPSLVADVLAALAWNANELTEAIPPGLAYAGAWHLVLAVRTKHRLDALAYDFARMKRLMVADNITTLQLVWRDSADVFHARNPFPVGGVIEDPATGAAAAALGGYLRDSGLISAPVRLRIRQGEAMGRPSLLTVDIPVRGGIIVRGTAVPIAESEIVN